MANIKGKGHFWPVVESLWNVWTFFHRKKKENTSVDEHDEGEMIIYKDNL